MDPEHPAVALSVKNLAGLYDTTGRGSTLRPGRATSALAIWEKALGPEHPGVARIIENYASVLCQAGHEMQARPLNAHAQAIREKHKS